jgi:PAP2 superfamily
VSPRQRRSAWWLLPGELALLGFLLYAVAFILFHNRLSSLHGLEIALDVRGGRLMLALWIVGAFQIVRSFRMQTPLGPEKLERRMVFLLLPVVLPMTLAAWVESQDPLWSKWLSARADDQLHLLFMFVLRVFGMGSPLLALWAWIGLGMRLEKRISVDWVIRRGLLNLATWLREWLPVIILLPCYSWMADVIGTPTHIYDDAIQAVDRFLFFGTAPVLALQNVVYKAVSEWLAFSYSFYALAYGICLGAVSMKGRVALREGITAISLGLALTFVGYSLVPVQGPLFSMTFDVPLDFYYIESVKEMLMDRDRITFDCFPSFHTCGMALLSWLCFRHARKVFWFVLPMAVSTPLACVYLRYHYVADVLAGLILAAFVAPITLWACRRSPAPFELAKSDRALLEMP